MLELELHVLVQVFEGLGVEQMGWEEFPMEVGLPMVATLEATSQADWQYTVGTDKEALAPYGIQSVLLQFVGTDSPCQH